MATLDRTPARPASSGAQPRVTRGSSQTPASVAVDHWTYVFIYSMGIGTLAVAALLFTVLIAVWLYGQFVWSFTQWDLADVRLAPFKPLAYLLIAGAFLGGTCAGLWVFSGAAWKNQRSQTTAARRPSR